MDIGNPSSGSMASSPAAPGGAGDTTLGGLGILAGLGAILVSSCCVVPLLLALVGLGGVAAAAQDVGLSAAWQPYLLAMSGLMLGAAWLVFFRRRRQVAQICAAGACDRPAAPWITGSLLAVATLAFLLALLWGRLEPHVLQWLLK